jgi:hypothetical protein
MKVSAKDTTSYFQIGFQLAALITVVAGIALSSTPLLNYWSTSPRQGLLIWLAISAVVIPLNKFVALRSANLTLICMLTLFLLAGNGYMASLACLLFCLSVFSLGRFIARGISNERWSIAGTLIIGFASYAAVFGTMIHFPVNYRWVYLALLSAPVLIDLALLARQQKVKQTTAAFITSINAVLSPVAYWKMAVLLTVIGFFSCYSFMCSVTADDNSYHMAMWSQLRAHHQYLFDVATQVWYTAPFTSDVIHGVLSIIANEDARGALNIVLLVALLTVTAATGSHLFPSLNIRLLALAFLASTPMLFNLLLGLQTELMIATLATTGIYIGINTNTSFVERCTGIFLVSCLLVAIKLPMAVFAAALGLCLLISDWNNFPQLIRLPATTRLVIVAILIAGLGMALNSYVTSYLLTGNPVFPLYNAIFKSPFFNLENFKDNRFTHGPSLQAWWGMFFDSSKYLESKNFIVGFQYFLLPFAGIICLAKKIRLQTLLYLALPTLAFGGLMFYSVQYVRYLFPVMPIACLLIAGVFYAAPSTDSAATRLSRNTLTSVTAGILISLNLYFMPGVIWIFDQNPLKNLIPSQKLENAKSYNPEHVISLYINEHYPHENVLFERGRVFGALLLGKPFYPDWVSPKTLRAFDEMKNDEDVIAYLKENNIRFVCWDSGDNANSRSYRTHIKAAIDKYGKEEIMISGVKLYKIVF